VPNFSKYCLWYHWVSHIQFNGLNHYLVNIIFLVIIGPWRCLFICSWRFYTLNSRWFICATEISVTVATYAASVSVCPSGDQFEARVGPAWQVISCFKHLSSQSYHGLLSRPYFFNRSPILNAHAPALYGFLLYIQSDLVKPIMGSTVNIKRVVSFVAFTTRVTTCMMLSHESNLYRCTQISLGWSADRRLFVFFISNEGIASCIFIVINLPNNHNRICFYWFYFFLYACNDWCYTILVDLSCTLHTVHL